MVYVYYVLGADELLTSLDAPPANATDNEVFELIVKRGKEEIVLCELVYVGEL